MTRRVLATGNAIDRGTRSTKGHSDAHTYCYAVKYVDRKFYIAARDEQLKDEHTGRQIENKEAAKR